MSKQSRNRLIENILTAVRWERAWVNGKKGIGIKKYKIALIVMGIYSTA